MGSGSRSVSLIFITSLQCGGLLSQRWGTQGKLSDCAEALEPLRTKRDFTLAATHTLAFFHKRAARRDDREVESLEIAAEMALETAGDAGLYNAASVLAQCGEFGEAAKALDRMSRSGSMAQVAPAAPALARLCPHGTAVLAASAHTHPPGPGPCWLGCYRPPGCL